VLSAPWRWRRAGTVLNLSVVHEVAIETTRITSMVYLILVGATNFLVNFSWLRR
jgi:TRAP-type mannitol/chloroaromatic compound transport system permease large subunit